MAESPLVSIIINNYNYRSFLSEAIRSAQDQTYSPLEIVVVDDGSTDGSRELIASCGSSITAVLKPNGGQTSALNVGYRVSNGELIHFLDSDDLLAPDAIEHAVRIFKDGEPAKVHWPLAEIDAAGKPTGRLQPGRQLSAGDLRAQLVDRGPEGIDYPPTSGNVFARSFLDRVFPLPEIERRHGLGSASADAYLSVLAPLYGLTGASERPLGYYRVHGNNDYSSTPFDQRLGRDLMIYDHLCDALAGECAKLGIDTDLDRWRRTSWIYRLHAVRQTLSDLVPEGATAIVIDDGQWGAGLHPGFRALPLVEQGGQYWGPPADEAHAVRELERLRAAGAEFVVFGWPAFWWLEHYPALEAHLRGSYLCLLEDDRLIIFSLRADGMPTLDEAPKLTCPNA